MAKASRQLRFQSVPPAFAESMVSESSASRAGGAMGYTPNTTLVSIPARYAPDERNAFRSFFFSMKYVTPKRPATVKNGIANKRPAREVRFDLRPNAKAAQRDDDGQGYDNLKRGASRLSRRCVHRESFSVVPRGRLASLAPRAPKRPPKSCINPKSPFRAQAKIRPRRFKKISTCIQRHTSHNIAKRSAIEDGQ